MRALLFLVPLLTGCATPIIDLPAIVKTMPVPANYCPYGTVRSFDSCQAIQRVEVINGRQAAQPRK